MPLKKKPVIKRAKPKKVLPRPVPKIEVKPAGRYLEAVGRRKTSVARVRMTESGNFSVSINGRTLEQYFPTFELKEIVLSPFKRTGAPANFLVSVKVKGGGIHSQAEAIRHGISRVLETREPELRKILKPLGFLKRDPRMKERRKFGLKKARKAPQWAKR